MYKVTEAKPSWPRVYPLFHFFSSVTKEFNQSEACFHILRWQHFEHPSACPWALNTAARQEQKYQSRTKPRAWIFPTDRAAQEHSVQAQLRTAFICTVLHILKAVWTVDLSVTCIVLHTHSLRCLNCWPVTLPCYTQTLTNVWTVDLSVTCTMLHTHSLRCLCCWPLCYMYRATHRLLQISELLTSLLHVPCYTTPLTDVWTVDLPLLQVPCYTQTHTLFHSRLNWPFCYMHRVTHSIKLSELLTYLWYTYRAAYWPSQLSKELTYLWYMYRAAYWPSQLSEILTYLWYTCAAYWPSQLSKALRVSGSDIRALLHTDPHNCLNPFRTETGKFSVMIETLLYVLGVHVNVILNL